MGNRTRAPDAQSQRGSGDKKLGRGTFIGTATAAALGGSLVGSTEPTDAATQRLHTPIAKLLNLTPAQLKELTPTARKLTPSDMAAVARCDANVQVGFADLTSLNNAIRSTAMKRVGAGNVGAADGGS